MMTLRFVFYIVYRVWPGLVTATKALEPLYTALLHRGPLR